MIVRAQQVLVRWLACGSVVLVVSCGSYSILKRIYAERLALGSTRDVEHALSLVADNPAYWLRRADLLDLDGQSPTASLEAAAERAPYDAGIWIRLGVDAEARGDFRSAESSLIRAARVSHLYQPRWTLANYYFRRGSPQEFWKWTRQALELAPSDSTPLFRLCWRMSADPNEIFKKAIPKDRRLWREYASFLMAQNQMEGARTVIEQVLSGAESEDRDVLLAACDKSIAPDSADFALAIWNTLCGRGLLDSSVIHVGANIPLSENSPDSGAFGHGFAWRAGNLDSVEYMVRSGVMTFEFSGREPENTELLWRWIPVTPGRKAVVRFEYQTAGLPARSGVVLQVIAGGEGRPPASSTWLSGSEWKSGEVRFDVNPGVQAARLCLRYSRPPGEVRVDGSLFLRAMRLETEP